MMLECLIKRVGPTPIILGNVKYMFNQLPWITGPDGKKEMAKSGEPSTSVCEVTQAEHLQYFLKSPQFREYKEGQPAPEDEREAEGVINLSGYSIPKYLDKGYIVVDSKRKRYAGSDGQWKDSNKDLVPFESEFAAFQWLKEEAQFEEEASGTFTCSKCHREGFKSKAGLSGHEATCKGNAV